jgi:hypothetical protein
MKWFTKLETHQQVGLLLQVAIFYVLITLAYYAAHPRPMPVYAWPHPTPHITFTK